MKTFEERNQEIVDCCEKEYLDKGKEWWKTHKTVYKTTKALVPHLNNFDQTSDLFFGKKDYYHQLLVIVFLLIFGLIGLKIIFEEALVIIFIGCSFIFVIILVLLIFKLKDKSAKVVLTKNCFWFYKMEKHIP